MTQLRSRSLASTLASRGRSIAPRWLWLSACAAMVSSACGSNGGQTGDEHNGLEELKGVAQRLSVSGALPNSASSDGWDFGWKFYAEEATPAQNAFFSPYSISVVSAMLIAGAAGETRVRKVVRDLLEAQHVEIRELPGRGDDARGVDSTIHPAAPLHVPCNQNHRMPARMKDWTNCR